MLQSVCGVVATVLGVLFIYLQNADSFERFVAFILAASVFPILIWLTSFVFSATLPLHFYLYLWLAGVFLLNVFHKSFAPYRHKVE